MFFGVVVAVLVAGDADDGISTDTGREEGRGGGVAFNIDTGRALGMSLSDFFCCKSIQCEVKKKRKEEKRS